MEVNKAYEKLLKSLKNGSIVNINKAFSVMIIELTKQVNYSKNHNTKTNKKLQKNISDIRRQFTNTYNEILKKYEASAISLAERKNIIEISAALKGLENSSGITKTLLGRPTKPNVKIVSQRVWNVTKRFYDDLNNVLKSGLLEGQSAHTIKLQLTRLLNDPAAININELRRSGINKAGGEAAYRQLERSVINKKGKLGLYKSAKKNAYRLARTEINRAYRQTDTDIRKGLPFITGIEVKLSSAHPREDICDDMKGVYPKDYNFLGWHPACICYTVPILATKEETAKIIAGQKVNLKQTTKIPKQAKSYIKDKSESINNLKTTPFFIDENKKYFEGLL